MNRDVALTVMHEYTKSESLRKHMACVETAMRAYAEKFQQDVERWGITGLIHDFDYEKYPNPPDHPIYGAAILREKGFPADVVVAVLGHADYTGVPRETLMAKTLFACDELCGFLVACTKVRPDKKIESLEVSSVKKKLKDKAFARNVSREDIELGAREIGIPLDDHIQFVINALRKNAVVLGL